MKKHHSCRIGFFKGLTHSFLEVPKNPRGHRVFWESSPVQQLCFFFRGAGRRPREKLMKPGRSASSPDVRSFVNGY